MVYIYSFNKKYLRLVLVILFALAFVSLYQFIVINKNKKQPTKTPFKLPKIVYRQDFGVLMESMGGETIIEIGTHKGWFAKDMLSKWPSFKKYYGIDPWKEQRFYKDASNVREEYQIKAYEYALKSLSDFSDRIVLYKDFSSNVVKKFEPESIDFIYLDGRHDYCGVMSDLTLYYPILKCGGVMAGNAYLTVAEQFNLSNDDFSLCENGDVVLQNGGGPKGALSDFAQVHKIQNIMSTREKWPSFYFLKVCDTD